MSTEIAEPKTQEQAPTVDDRWLKAYLEGNMRFPQSDFGIELFLIYGLFEDPNPDIKRFVESKLNPQQIQLLKDAMNAAHAHRNIPISSTDQIKKTTKRIERETGKTYNPKNFQVDDERLEMLWTGFRNGTISLLKRILIANKNIILSDDYFPTDGESIEKLESDPEARKTVKELSELSVEALRSEEGKRLTHEYREAFNLKRYGQPEGRIDTKIDLRFEIDNRHIKLNNEESLADKERQTKNYIIKYVGEKNPKLSEILNTVL